MGIEDKLVIVGDFNARVNIHNQTWQGILGRNGLGNSSKNNYLVLKTSVSLLSQDQPLSSIYLNTIKLHICILAENNGI